VSSFFDEYKDIGGGEYVGKDEKDVLIDNGIPFQVTDVVYQEESKYGERFVTRVLLPDTESGEYDDERLMSFSAGGMVESRDRLLRAMAEWLDEADNEPPWVKLTRVGRAVIIERAEAPEKPKAKGRGRSAKK
jgi:hypothetical protein